jgi:uncharacterized protein (TIGR02466 family)
MGLNKREMIHSSQVTEDQLFPSQVWHTDLAHCDDLNASLLTEISALRKSTKSIKKSNELGWHSPTNMHKREGFKQLCDSIHAMADVVAESMKLRADRRLVIETFWVNANPKHAYNSLHEHPRSVLSGVYYVQADEKSGRLRFRDPRGAKRMNPWQVQPKAETDVRHWDRVPYEPVAGRLILFPSWLEHDVESNGSDLERISISFNMGLQKKVV